MYLGAATSPAVKARQAIELRIIHSLIDELLSQDFQLSVFDGEDETKPTTDRAVIVDAIYNTAGKCIGWVRLVYGNDGWDVICDRGAKMAYQFPVTVESVKRGTVHSCPRCGQDYVCTQAGCRIAPVFICYRCDWTAGESGGHHDRAINRATA